MQTGLEKRIALLLRQRNLKLSLAESCTGGLVSHRITNIPGSSEYYLGGVISYADSAKRMLLGVKAETLDQYGAVSREVVIEMARGVRKLFSLQGYPAEEIIGMAISGIAGPGGGTAEKPIGLVWIGLCAADGEWAWKFHREGNRLENKENFSDQALQLLWGYLTGYILPES
jgi:PncC family amidohydrolase